MCTIIQEYKIAFTNSCIVDFHEEQAAQKIVGTEYVRSTVGVVRHSGSHLFSSTDFLFILHLN
jgi:hypothetical protein